MLAFPDKTGSLVLAACIWFLFVHPDVSHVVSCPAFTTAGTVKLA